MRISDWSSDVCSSDLLAHLARDQPWDQEIGQQKARKRVGDAVLVARHDGRVRNRQSHRVAEQRGDREPVGQPADHRRLGKGADETDRRMRSEEHTSELQSLMRISYAVFCLKKKNTTTCTQ